MQNETPFYHEKSVSLLVRSLVRSIQKYYINFSTQQAKKLEERIRFVQQKYPKTFQKRLYVLDILMTTNPDLDTLSAVFFMPLGSEKFSDSEILEYGGKEVSTLLKGVEKVSGIHYQGENNAGVVRRFLLSQINDVRVLYLRIAKRIGLLQKIRYEDFDLPAKKKERYIQGALHISVPLLAQLGVYHLKILLEDTCFSLLEPEKYANILNKIQEHKTYQKSFFRSIQSKILKICEKKSLSILSITGRNKGISSIAEKITRKDYFSFEEVLDIIGIRIIVKTPQECYALLSALHTEKEFLSESFKDYISSPKLNGYQSLHTTLLGLSDKNPLLPIEVQIRTETMHHHAEIGSASHWEYKGGSNMLGLVSNDITPHANRFHIMKQVINQKKKIYSFTPTGEVKELPEGATPIDFAYSIHSDVGDHCMGAIVNERIVPLHTPLKTGEFVEILTSPQKKPNAEWLNFVVSDSARHKIQNYLNTHTEGGTLSAHQKEKQKQQQIKREYRKKLDQQRSKLQKKITTVVEDSEIIIGGEKELVHHFAQCCCPKEKLSIVAYSSNTRNFVIHASDCKNLLALDESRILSAEWKNKK